jgi:acyl carrier protein
MTNIEKYNEVFIESFGIKAEDLNDKLTYQSITEWDSVGHMGLVAAIEENFNILIDIDDIIDFGSYTIGKDILKKYGVEL